MSDTLLFIMCSGVDARDLLIEIRIDGKRVGLPAHLTPLETFPMRYLESCADTDVLYQVIRFQDGPPERPEYPGHIPNVHSDRGRLYVVSSPENLVGQITTLLVRLKDLPLPKLIMFLENWHEVFILNHNVSWQQSRPLARVYLNHSPKFLRLLRKRHEDAKRRKAREKARRRAIPSNKEPISRGTKWQIGVAVVGVVMVIIIALIGWVWFSK